ncbi:MAG TPA: hypothetical protein VK530_07095 [Candidatus Acidoferrum sp.]|nr:hypothetical protein [Candidatus Acidoferrum sp.]
MTNSACFGSAHLLALSATSFALDQSPTATGAWSQVSFPYATNATDISITVPASAGNKFYRLRKP